MSGGTWFQTGASPAQVALPPATSPPTPVLGMMLPRGPGAGLLAGVRPCEPRMHCRPRPLQPPPPVVTTVSHRGGRAHGQVFPGL